MLRLSIEIGISYEKIAKDIKLADILKNLK